MTFSVGKRKANIQLGTDDSSWRPDLKNYYWRMDNNTMWNEKEEQHCWVQMGMHAITVECWIEKFPMWISCGQQYTFTKG